MVLVFRMFHKVIYIFIISFLIFSCSKKEPVAEIPNNKEKSFEIYKEALENLEEGQYFYASKKFSEAENILPQIEFAAKSALMSGYCLYLINFYTESEEALERFIKKYPADKNIQYAQYLLAII